MNNEYTYWIALTQLRNWRIQKINELIIKIIQEEKSSLDEFFNLNDKDYRNKFNLEEKEIISIEEIKKELPQFSFLVEDLLSQGYELITINSPKYSPTLKENLKIKHSPSVLYVKGNTQLLQENSIAIVGSREADEISLKFTDNIAKIATKDFKVIVSGFAKGVDQQALVSTLKYIGQSIIVLPQGIMTFNSGFNKYYQEIQRGDVLVLSTFHPKAPWSVQLAMARNPIIYGLAKEIFVAQSSDSGGTWSGVLDGLKKEVKIYVRKPEPNEANANNLLIEKGALAVDIDGNLLNQDPNIISAESAQKSVDEILKENIYNILQNAELTSKEILTHLKLNWSAQKLNSYLKNLDGILVLNNKPLKFTINGDNKQVALF
ncbi:MAG: DNA-processing protein DprA [FCB group bacterium]|jgi:predicted Rossmann fold nucleotide-binding protein DprA/Smf involved in DNA uptake